MKIQILCLLLLFSPLCVLTNDGPIENEIDEEAEEHSNSDENLRTVSSKFGSVGRLLTSVLALQSAQLTQGAMQPPGQSSNGVQNSTAMQNSSTTNTFKVTNDSIPQNYFNDLRPRIPTFNNSHHLKEIGKEISINEEDQNETSVVSGTGHKLNKKHKDKLIVYHNVTDGCSLIKCTNNSACAIRTGIASLGNGMFEQFDYPKCIMDPYQLSHNTDPDGNSHIKKDGPGCNLVKCAEVEGFSCHVRISVSKLGNRPYAQVLGGFPQCVHSSKAYDESTNIIMEGGPGCDKIQCFNGEKCKVSVGIAKYGNSKWSQFFWPYCV